jgi:dTMP kinase
MQMGKSGKKGKLIVICGIDGSGKTTLQNSLAKYLTERGEQILETRQPTDAYRKNSDVRQYLDTGESNISINTLAMLAATDRMLHIEKIILPQIESGAYVICDRYVYSTYAYFQARGANMTFVKTINQFVPPPDAGIFLNIDVNIAMQRTLKRDGTNRKFEEKNLHYLERVQDYLKSSLPTCFAIIDGAQPESQIFSAALHHLEVLDVYR